MEQIRPYVVPLPTISITGSASAQRDITPLKELPPEILGGLFAHLVKIIFSVTLTPTHTTAPTTVGVNNLFEKMDLYDGRVNRFTGGFNEMRMFERLPLGKNVFPDADTDTASGTARYFYRELDLGHAAFRGNPTDFMLPVGALRQGKLAHTTGVLTDISADCTAYTATVQPLAVLAGLSGEIRIPPHVERFTQDINAKDFPIQGDSAYLELALAKASTYDAFSAGDVGNVKLDFGFGADEELSAEDLHTVYWSFVRPGDVGGFRGEPQAASEDNHKIVNRASPTALAAGQQDLNVMYFSPPGSKLSKARVAGESLRIRYDGSDSSLLLLGTRVLRQPPTVSARIGRDAARAVGIKSIQPEEIVAKGLKGRPYTGPLADFFPHTIKRQRAA